MSLRGSLGGRLHSLKGIQEDSKQGLEAFGRHGPQTVLRAPLGVDTPIQSIPKFEASLLRLELVCLLLPRCEGIELGLQDNEQLFVGRRLPLKSLRCSSLLRPQFDNRCLDVRHGGGVVRLRLGHRFLMA